MSHKELLLERLAQIGLSLQQTGEALGLLGLGSVGKETHRLDDYSDLDFFAIVKSGQKYRFIENLDWLSNLEHIAYCFRNTHDGYKLLFADGVFCEFAVFEPQELEAIPFAPGKMIWQADDFNSEVCEPRIARSPAPSSDVNWLLGEALTNLYVGMCRFNRGEKLSAMRFVQQYAIDRIFDLVHYIEPQQAADPDPFAIDRRFERLYPTLTKQLPQMLGGYDKSPQSALAQLSLLDQYFEINQAMKMHIEKLCQQ